MMLGTPNIQSVLYCVKVILVILGWKMINDPRQNKLHFNDSLSTSERGLHVVTFKFESAESVGDTFVLCMIEADRGILG